MPWHVAITRSMDLANRLPRYAIFMTFKQAW